jgi:predicted DNA-binding protein (MmcQ/YjbR family)
MTREEFEALVLDTYGIKADYPFEEDFETAVLRHTVNQKWYALVMCVSRRKFGIDSDEMIDVVNLKLPLELFG